MFSSLILIHIVIFKNSSHFAPLSYQMKLRFLISNGIQKTNHYSSDAKMVEFMSFKDPIPRKSTTVIHITGTMLK